jgi:hypothetical protein
MYIKLLPLKLLCNMQAAAIADRRCAGICQILISPFPSYHFLQHEYMTFV